MTAPKWPPAKTAAFVIVTCSAFWVGVYSCANAAPDLQAVNRAVNASIRPQVEPIGHDVWAINPATGDCEDYALTKMVRLADLGVPLADMSILVVKVGRQQHAVLAVGDRVLDNRYPTVMRRSDYTPIRTVSANVALFRAKMQEPK